METTTPLEATVRTAFGKGPSRQLRMTGQIPVVVYRRAQDPLHLTVSVKELGARLKGEYGLNARFRLNVAGQENTPVVMLKEYQRDPVRREITHADFIEVDPERQITARVPLVLEGRPVGVRQGGRLRQVRRDLVIKARAADIPVAITVDVTELKVNAFHRIAEVQPPAGVALVFDSNFAIATVTMPRGTAVADEE